MKNSDNYVKTEHIASEGLMRLVYGSRVDDDRPTIKVHVGEWRAETFGWWLWRDPEIRRQ